ncbi:MAG: archaellin/type IV pilin N-terminal domain-containing protein [Candidatus Nezhaarchaeales archaeon]
MAFDRKAISPVIATIIIVAVAIVMSIAVAYWMMGLTTTFTRYEKLEYTAAYVVPTEVHVIKGVEKEEGVKEEELVINVWNVTLKLKNTGTAVATINDILINGVPLKVINETINKAIFGTIDGNFSVIGNVSGAVAALPATVSVGETVAIVLSLPKNETIQFPFGKLTFGMSLEIIVVTAAGYQYPKTVVLP